LKGKPACYNLPVTKKQTIIISGIIVLTAALIAAWRLWPQPPQPIPVEAPAQDESLLSVADIVGVYKEEKLEIPRMTVVRLGDKGDAVLFESTPGPVRPSGYACRCPAAGRQTDS
jgi:hypothetical protein